MIVCKNVFCVSCMNLHFSLCPWLAYSVVQVFDGFVDGIAIFAPFLHCACDDFEFNVNNSKSQDHKIAIKFLLSCLLRCWKICPVQCCSFLVLLLLPAACFVLLFALYPFVQILLHPYLSRLCFS